MNAISSISQFPTNKEQIEIFAEQCVQEILSGVQNPLDFEILLNGMEKLIDKIRKDIRVKQIVQNEAELYPDKTFNYKGIKITKCLKLTPDFSQVTWSKYVECSYKIESLKETKKQYEDMMKTLKEPFADADTGEILNPILFKKSDYLKLEI